MPERAMTSSNSASGYPGRTRSYNKALPSKVCLNRSLSQDIAPRSLFLPHSLLRTNSLVAARGEGSRDRRDEVILNNITAVDARGPYPMTSFHLTPEQPGQFERDGFLLVRGLFDAEEM